MKSKLNLSVLVVILLLSISTYCQTPWYLTGNNIASTNYFGTNNNFPIDFRTNNINRMRLMQNGSATINGGAQTVNYNGFLGLSADPAYWTNSLFTTNII